MTINSQVRVKMGDAIGGEDMSIPATCYGAVVKNEGPNFYVQVEELPVPEIKPNEVLIRLNATGLCMSDIHFMMNDWANMPKMSSFGTKCAGHEGAGVIVKVGDQVSRLKIGQRAGYKPYKDVCHTCKECKKGKEVYCSKAVVTGLHCNGSYMQYVASPERYTTILPDGISDFVAGPIMCSASTAYTSIKESNLKPGQWALFLGGGSGVGIQGVQLAVAMGLRPIVVDTTDERRDLSLSLGAEHFVDFAKVGDPVEAVLQLTNGGVDGVFVTAAPAYPQALKYLGDTVGGTVMCIGLPPTSQSSIDLEPSALIFRNQSIKGTLVSNLTDVDETLQFAQRGKLKLEPVVVGLSQFNSAVQSLKNGKVIGRMVVDFNAP